MLSTQEIIKKRKLFDGIDKEIAESCKALSDVNRCKIFRLISSEPRLSVSTISKVINISLPLASQHLKILTHNRMIEKEKNGQRTFYKLRRDNPSVHYVLKAIKQYAQYINRTRP